MKRIRAGLEGQRFGRLLVIGKDEANKTKNSRWICKCDCGAIKSISRVGLTSGDTGSCGCLNKEMTIQRNTTHGMSNTIEYATWRSMIARCYNKNAENYPSYGGRGIAVCKRWLESFEIFYADMGVRPSSGHSIDRIKCNEGYSPDNCRWATIEEQMNNMTTNRVITFNGKSQTMSEWAREIGVSCNCIYLRLDKCGMSVERALTMKFYSKVKK